VTTEPAVTTARGAETTSAITIERLRISARRSITALARSHYPMRPSGRHHRDSVTEHSAALDGDPAVSVTNTTLRSWAADAPSAVAAARRRETFLSLLRPAPDNAIDAVCFDADATGDRIKKARRSSAHDCVRA
jgi:hypothetical protein